MICDVGGVDVKIMILRQGTVSDFRLNSQCSSGNGAFLQGVAERYNVPLEQYAERADQVTSVLDEILRQKWALAIFQVDYCRILGCRSHARRQDHQIDFDFEVFAKQRVLQLDCQGRIPV